MATDNTGRDEGQQARLVATYPILYLSHQYRAGDELPASDSEMTEAWLAAGTAAWISDEKESTVKAKPAAAEAGAAGAAAASESENGENLAGKVPKTAARKKK